MGLRHRPQENSSTSHDFPVFSHLSTPSSTAGIAPSAATVSPSVFFPKHKNANILNSLSGPKSPSSGSPYRTAIAPLKGHGGSRYLRAMPEDQLLDYSGVPADTTQLETC